MKALTSFVILSFVLLVACNDSKPEEGQNTTELVETPASNTPTPPKTVGIPVSIKGTIEGMKEGQKIFFDKKTLDATEVVASVALDAAGNFAIDGRIPNPGVYRIRLGIKSIYLLLKGNESIAIKAKLDGYDILEKSITGVDYAVEMEKWSEVKKVSEIAKYLQKTTEAKPLFHLYLVEKLDIAVHMDLYKKVRDEMVAAYPNLPYTNQFNSKVLTIEAKLNAQPVAIGREAPEINLPNPDGKKIALSSLRGKVVLLDFWASWCMPCRRTNPAVVALYKKYKKQGFEIYSVSFDGADDRKMASFGGNQEVIANYTVAQKNAWIKAIKDDKLEWKSHVSELRGWSSQVGQVYQVSGIPRTFLLDRNGLVRFDNLHGAQLEEAIQKLLNEK